MGAHAESRLTRPVVSADSFGGTLGRTREKMSKRDAPATHRNREPILAELRRWLPGPDRLRVLEIASGTGQHATFFAARMPHVQWQPSEIESGGLASIAAWAAEGALENLAPAVAIDVRETSWPVEAGFDAVFNANLIHIAPWEVALALFAGAARVLCPGGLLLLYGPFRIDGEHTAPSNAAFDTDLRRRDPSWGVRDLAAIDPVAAANGLRRIAMQEMPAHNRLLVFRRETDRDRADPGA